MKRQQQGFTLIELVIVIVILGILSAFALPRFADLGGDARAAAIEGAAGSVKSASSIVRSACLADSNCDDTSASINLEGVDIDLVGGYPAASADGIQAAAQLEGDNSGNGDYEISFAGSTPDVMTVSASGASGTCQVQFTEVDTSTDPNTAPSTTTDTSDC